jgi:hypothetical protein
MSFIETPLKDALDFIKDRHGIPIVLKTRKLQDVGINPDTPVSKELKGIRLRSALNLILDDFDLTYIVKDDVLQITTPDDAQSTLEVRVYDCRDLLDWPVVGLPPQAGGGLGAEGAAAAPGGGFAAPTAGGLGGPAPGMPGMPGGFGGMGMAAMADHDQRAMRLMTIITTNVEPQSWHAMGQVPAAEGSPSVAGAVSEYNGLIVVTQTAQTHKKIEHVLDMLREAAGIEQPQDAKAKVVR